MTLYISVVNHNHDSMICENPTIINLSKEHSVILKSNTKATSQLKRYCLEGGIHLIENREKKGFGQNNNDVFDYAKNELNMKEKDYFLVLNPDVYINNSTINKLLERVIKDKSSISTINLFNNREMTEFDNSVRKFPCPLNPIRSILGLKRTDQYDKAKIISPQKIDWAAGSFLLFRTEVFDKLQGFDQKFFMYFEDVDICKRAYIMQEYLIYYPDYKAVHLAQHSNRKIFNKSFYYYIKSMLTYYSNE